MYSIMNNKVSKIEQSQYLIKLYSDKESIQYIVDDYIKEIKDYSKDTNIFKFNLVPDSTFCKSEVVPDLKGVYSVDLNKYLEVSDSTELKIADIKNIIRFNLDKNKLIYLKKIMPLLKKNESIIKKNISIFYNSPDKELSLGLKDNKIVSSGYIVPFVTISKEDKYFIQEVKSISKNIDSSILNESEKHMQIEEISKALLYKQITFNILKEVEDIESFKKKNKSLK